MSGYKSENSIKTNCPMRHKNGNCLPQGGFCTAVSDSICEGLHNAYSSGVHDANEQLVKERDAATAIVEELADMDYCHNFQNGDFWVVDFICKISKTQKKAKEWRGVTDGNS